ncbi:MAG: imidazole glycerol phosphate synthase subunit HisH [Pseudomonadota bacterium]
MSTGVVIVDSGGANIASLRCALARLDCDPLLSADPEIISNASHVILPGVGAAADAMERLDRLALTPVIPSLTQPVLGICLGMQLLAQHSAEDDTTCLGITGDDASLLTTTDDLPVPHMGWNQIHTLGRSALLRGIEAGAFFYFVHSYALPISDSSIARCHYGQDFAAIMQRDNFFGTQFHPERSARTGARLLANFIEL